jgi:hypothetical protein
MFIVRCMNLETEKPDRRLTDLEQFQDEPEWTKHQIPEPQQRPRIRKKAIPFTDRPCPICGRFGCEGC